MPMTGSPASHSIGTVAELWRYPVKGMRGEQLASLTFDRHGVAGDRRLGLRSSGAPAGKPLLTGRERAQLLLYAARPVGDLPHSDDIVITTPSGDQLRLDDPAALLRLARSLGQGNTLSLVRSVKPLTDCRPVALLSVQTIRRLESEFGAPIDPRRFRANLLLDLADSVPNGTSAFPEDALVGRDLRLGDLAVLHITERDPRCRIVILDPETAAPEPKLMKLIDRLHDGRTGVYATVLLSGTVRPGDPVVAL